MAIKKLENNKLPGILIKVFLIAGLTAGGIYGGSRLINRQQVNGSVLSAQIRKNISQNKNIQSMSASIEKTAGDFLSEAAQIVTETANVTKDKTEDYVLKTAVSKVMEQVNKLPEKEREKIKEEMCK